MKAANKTNKNGTPKKKKENVGEKLQVAIVEATQVAKQIDELTAKLDTLKSAIRDHALPLMGDEQNSLTIDTEFGKCHIVKVKDQLVITPGIDADVLRHTLPEDLWNLFFVLKPQLRGTAAEAFLRLSDEHRIMLGDPLPFEFQPRQAQVRLPK